MTNQSGIDTTSWLTGEGQQENERQCRQHRGTGLISAIPVPAYRHHNTFHAAPRDSSIRCCIHCSTSLFARSGRCGPAWMGFGKWPSLISLAKPFYRSCRWNWWCSSCRSRGSTRHAAIHRRGLLLRSTWVRISSVRFMKVGQMRGESAETELSELALLGYRDCRQGNSLASGSLYSGDRGAKLPNALIRSLNRACSPATGDPVPIPRSASGAALLHGDAKPSTLLRASSIQPIQFGAAEILLSDAIAPTYGIPGFPDDGSEPAKVASGFRIHQRTDGFDKIHTKPGLSAAGRRCHVPRQTKRRIRRIRGAGLLTQHAQGHKWLCSDKTARRVPCYSRKIRNSIHKICFRYAAHNASLPVNELSTCLWFMDEIDNKQERSRTEDKDRTPDSGSRMNDLPLTSVHIINPRW